MIQKNDEVSNEHSKIYYNTIEKLVPRILFPPSPRKEEVETEEEEENEKLVLLRSMMVEVKIAGTEREENKQNKTKKNRCAAGRTVKVKTCCEALTFDKVGREKGLK